MGHEVVGIITVNACYNVGLVPPVKFMVERDLQIHVHSVGSSTHKQCILK